MLSLNLNALSWEAMSSMRNNQSWEICDKVATKGNTAVFQQAMVTIGTTSESGLGRLEQSKHHVYYNHYMY